MFIEEGKDQAEMFKKGFIWGLRIYESGYDSRFLLSFQLEITYLHYATGLNLVLKASSFS